ncbi:MAG: class I SAM-dependent DNA methyltransferase [Spirochaetaceae bacterium]|nr:class I SAM-dependent DNA methyltransferase [Spirochaetaceae bacterium]
MLSQQEQKKAAKNFVANWTGHGYEKGESQKFWIDLLTSVYGVEDIAQFIFFEEQVKDKIQNKTITNFIDAYIPSTRVMIEQKSSQKDLREPIKQSDGSLLTPFQQAKKYVADLPLSQHPKWIITCNFDEFLVYDMENPNGEPEEIFLKNLEKEFYRLSFITDTGSQHLKKEMELSIKAGDIVGLIYDQLLEQYKLAKNIDIKACLKSLNMLCVRLVFCFYAEDAGIFGQKSMFGDYLKHYEAKDLRAALLNLFKVLDQKPEERDPFLEEELAAFPYVNGGLFTEQDLLIPNFTEELKDLLINKASSDFDWADISPTIFGAVFESTLNPETRRSGGMHYTSIENIHKVIDPLFMDELNAEYEEIRNIKTVTARNEKLLEFSRKLGSLKFLDPACGSGNFLTETYLSLRRLENKCLQLMIGGNETQGTLTELFGHSFVKVHIQQFYGIEINDFACVVAKTALWIAECQMLQETNAITNSAASFLPLDNYTNIIEGNALRTDWETVVPKNELNYIMGNPPFVGSQYMSKEQKNDLMTLFADNKHAGELDFVAGWYKKAATFIKGTNIKCAFVSTNSITQGEQVAAIWKPLFNQFGIHFNFAYRTFRWDSEANIKAHVHCVIIGFSSNESKKEKTIYLNESQKITVKNINGYLLDANDAFIESRSKPLCNVPAISKGCQPTDGGNLIIEEKDYEDFIKQEPNAKKYIKKLVGAQEFINNKKRYCLWLVGANPSEIRKMPLVMKRIEACRQMRLNSSDKATRKLAETPTLFRETYNPKTFIIVPSVSSERRRYIPIGFLDENTISTNLNLIIPEASLYHFGVLTSNVHMAWMRAVAGRLEMRYRYSKDIVYNNFPWCNPTDEQKAKIEQTAQAILDARAKYPDSSLADLYDETVMPPELRKAHQENDKAVMQAYGFNLKMTESECVAELFKLYEQLAKNGPNQLNF